MEIIFLIYVASNYYMYDNAQGNIASAQCFATWSLLGLLAHHTCCSQLSLKPW